MTLNNFEKKFKDTLENRQIKPSPRAWKEVTSQLNVNESQTNRRAIWIGIAAGFIGFLFISLLYFNTEQTAVPQEQIVVHPEKPAIQKVDEIDDIIPLKINEKSPSNVEIAIESEAELPTQDPIHKKEIAVVSGEKKESPHIPPLVVELQPKELVDVQINADFAQNSAQETEIKTNKELEVEALLMHAQMELSTAEAAKNKPIDPRNLLAEVEDDLDKSFRDQIFEKLKTGFVKVKTAVADRND